MATNSELFYKMKEVFNKGFENTEVTTANLAMKVRLNRQLDSFMLPSDCISQSYKKRIEEYWNPYCKVNIKYHAWYSSRNGICDPRYIPDDLYYTKIDQHFNNRKYGWGVNDKNYYSLYFPDAKQPRTIIRKINSIFYDEGYHIVSERMAIDMCKAEEAVVIKPSNETGGGRGIQFWHNNEPTSKLKDKILRGEKSLIIQSLIRQNEELEKIHQSSVNTLRIMTLIIGNEVHHISTVLRMGVNGNRVDNASAGGITCGVLSNGQLKPIAFNAHGVKFTEHPQGFKFSNCVVPNYGKAVEMVKYCHERMGHFRLVSWDVAIDRNGEPVLIEANLRNGECDFHQFNNGPLFGELTDRVLKEVFGK